MRERCGVATEFQPDMGQKGEIMAKLTPVEAIRAKCLDCCNGQMEEVRLCSVKSCHLYRYRHGDRPIDEGVISNAGEV